MKQSTADFSYFKRALCAREPLIGTFVKTPSPIISELLGMTGLDAVCLDSEHAPFDRLALDGCIHALRAAKMPSLVRVPNGAPEHVLNALDSGATGVVVPHVMSEQQACQVVQAAHFGPGGRGYAGSTRAAGFLGRPIAEHREKSANVTTVIAQIEDIEGVNAIDEIAMVKGIDCLFIGRIDLTVAVGAPGPDDPVVINMVERICEAGRKANKPVGMFVPHVSEAARWIEKGASLFLLESDQSLLLKGADALAADFRGL